ncbi:MAG: sigma-70 family RNA polymerase sigma factor [Planctomycetota bacterium]
MDETTTPDRDLLRRLAAKDEAAVQDFLERYWARVYRVSYHLLGDPGAAEDAAQETFVAALRGVDRLEDPRALRTWLFRIAENQAKKHQRSASRREAREQGPELQARARARRSGPVGQELEREELGAVVRDELQALSPKLRLALSLRYLEGLSLEQVADVLEVPRKTVSSRIRRGLDDLRGRLEPQALGLAAAGWPALVLAEALAGVDVPLPPAPVELSAALGAGAPEVAAPAARDVLRAAHGRSLSGLALIAGVLIAGFAGGGVWWALAADEPARLADAPPQGAAPAPPPAPRPSTTPGPAPAPATTPAPAGPPPAPVADPQPDPPAPVRDAPPRAPAGDAAFAPVAEVTPRRFDLGTLPRAPAARRLGRGLDPWSNGSALTSLAVHPGADWLVTGDASGTVKLWDRRSGQVRAELEPAHPVLVQTLTLSPDGRRAVSVGGGVLRVWDLSARRLIVEHSVSPRSAGARCTPDDALAVDVQGQVELWTGYAQEAPTRVRRFGAAGQALNALALSADGARLAVGADDALRVYDVSSGRELEALRSACDAEEDPRVACCALSPDGARVASGGFRGHLALYASGQAEPLGTAHRGRSLSEAALTADGALLSVGRDGLARWRVGAADALEREAWSLGRAGGTPAALALDPRRGRLLVGTTDGDLLEVDARSGDLLAPRAVEEAAEPEDHTDVINALALDPAGGRVASASHDGTVRIFDLASGAGERVLQDPRGEWATAVAWHPSGRWLASGHYAFAAGLRLWDPQTGEALRGIKESNVTCLSMHPRRPLLVSGGDWVSLWDLETGELIRTYGDEREQRQVTRVAISPDGARLAVATSTRLRFKGASKTAGVAALRVYDLETAQLLAARRLAEPSTWGLTWSPDGQRLLTGHEDGGLRLWGSLLEPEAQLLAHEGVIRDVAFSPDGARFYAASRDRRVSEWSSATLEPLRVFAGEPGTVRALAVGGEALVTAGDGRVPRAWPLR